MLRVNDPRRWALWQLPKPALALILSVFVVAVAALLPMHLPGDRPTDLRGFAVLAAVGIAASLACWRMERARRFIDASSVPNLVATWTFAGALSLDHVTAVAVVVVIFLVQWMIQYKVYAGRPHRYVFSAATVVVAVRCAQLVHEPLLSGVVLLGVNMTLVAMVLIASGNPQGVRRLADLRQQGVEVFTLMLGATAAALFQWHVLAIVAVAPAMVGLQFVALTRSIRQPSSFDPSTGVLTARAWHALGVLRLTQVREGVVLQIMISDVDGVDAAACASTVRASVRPEDLIGRTADGFSVLVAGSGDTMLAEMLALQMRARLAMNGIDTYVGVAVTPDRGRPVDLQGLSVTASADLIVKAANIRV